MAEQQYEYDVNIPGKGTITVRGGANMTDAEAYQAAIGQSAGPQTTGGQPGAPGMQPQQPKDFAHSYIAKALADPTLEAFPEELKKTTEQGGGLSAAVGLMLPETSIPGKIASGVGKITKTPIKLFKAKEEAIGKFAGKYLQQPETLAKRILQPVADEAKALYAAAEQAGPIKASGVVETLRDAYKAESAAATPNKSVLTTLKNLLNKYAGKGPADAKDLINEMQRLRATAEGLATKNPLAARTLYEVREAGLDALSQASPAIRAANTIVAKDSMAKDVLKILREAKPEQKLASLLEGSPRTAAMFGWDTPQKVDAVIKTAAKIGRTPSQGTIIKVLEGVAGSGLLAYAVHRGIFDAVFSGHGRGE